MSMYVCKRMRLYMYVCVSACAYVRECVALYVWFVPDQRYTTSVGMFIFTQLDSSAKQE